LALIPARGGSKSILKKNISLCAGKPLISYTLDAAKNSHWVTDIVVSTDCPAIAEVCADNGLFVDKLRPCSLAKDNTSAQEVLKYEILRLREENRNYAAIVYLQPTSPLRTSHHIDQAVQLFFEMQASSVVSVTEVPHHFNPEGLYIFNEQGGLCELEKSKKIYQRQLKKKYFARNGAAIYVLCPEVILNSESIFGPKLLPYFMNKIDSIDIDNEEDLYLAQLILQDRVLRNTISP